MHAVADRKIASLPVHDTHGAPHFAHTSAQNRTVKNHGSCMRAPRRTRLVTRTEPAIAALPQPFSASVVDAFNSMPRDERRAPVDDLCERSARQTRRLHGSKSKEAQCVTVFGDWDSSASHPPPLTRQSLTTKRLFTYVYSSSAATFNASIRERRR